MTPRYRPGDIDVVIFNRRVMLTSLDPIPRAFRACPGVLVVNQRELEGYRRGERDVVGELVEICQAEDAAEARGIYKPLQNRGRLWRGKFGLLNKQQGREQ